MARLNKRQEAQALALRGHTAEALDAFVALKNQGQVIASASIAEIAAFRGDWRTVLSSAESIFASPQSVEAGNVYTDLIGLAARAAASLADWQAGEDLASMALEKVSAIPDFDVFVLAAQRLLHFVERKGQGSELGDGLYFSLGPPSEPADERRGQFEQAIGDLVGSKKKRLSASPDTLEDLYALAGTYRFGEGAVQVFDRAHGELPRIFDSVSFAAAALARAGRREEAWQAIQTRLASWWPVVLSQVAPVQLLIDEALWALLTPERCKEVLDCPRGREATKK
ncbi:MAG: hypothetical protein M3Z16_12405 [Pseudomonadota bacterium]|nr:hypothetical protein [Pseudomonadota bacterium]